MPPVTAKTSFPQWAGLLRAMEEQWKLWTDRTSAATEAIQKSGEE
jgi:hypothetical protein